MHLVRTAAYIGLSIVAFASYQAFGLTLQGIGIAAVALGMVLLIAGIGRNDAAIEAHGCRQCGATHGHTYGFCIMCGHQPA